MSSTVSAWVWEVSVSKASWIGGYEVHRDPPLDGGLSMATVVLGDVDVM